MAIPVKRKPSIEGTNGSHPPLSTKTKKQILHNVKGTAATVIPINHLVKTRLITVSYTHLTLPTTLVV